MRSYEKQDGLRCLPRPRRGIATVEALASLATMAVLLAFVAQWSNALLQHRRAISRRREAMQATDNVIALAMASRFAELTDEHLLALARPYTPQRGVWDIHVEPIVTSDRSGVPLKTKRIVVGLTFEATSHYDIPPLVIWRYPTPPQGGLDD